MTLIMKYLCWLTHAFCIYIELILDFYDSAYVVFNCYWFVLLNQLDSYDICSVLFNFIYKHFIDE